MAETFTINNLPEPIVIETREFYSRTVQNAKNLLRLWKGEVPYDRMRGLDPALKHMPFAKLQSCIFAEVQRVMRWEPDVNLMAVRTKILDEGELYIEADILVEGRLDYA